MSGRVDLEELLMLIILLIFIVVLLRFLGVAI